MKHIALIMAHKNLRQVERLISALHCDDIDIVLHLDKKMEIKGEDDIAIINNLKAKKNIFICKRRIDGKLDDWTLPEITLEMIRTAKQHEKPEAPYHYFMLLSGQDYPLKSTNYILDFLSLNYPKPYIDIDTYEDEGWVRSKFMLVRWIHKIDDIHSKMRPGLLRKLRVAPYVLLESLERKFWGTPYDRISKLGLKPYGGSAWWILPDIVINEILSEVEDNPKIVTEFSRTWTPEETFFQTMAMRTSIANLIDIIPASEKLQQNCMTYANFSTPTKAFCGHPHTITSEEIEDILRCEQLFARKFDDTADSKVYDIIESHRNNPHKSEDYHGYLPY